MPDKPNVANDGHVGLLLLAGVGVLFATPVPFVLAAAAGAVAQLFGVRFAAFASLALGVAAAALAFASAGPTVRTALVRQNRFVKSLSGRVVS